MTDAGQRLPDAPRADFELPKVLDMQMRAISFEAPRHRNFKSALPSGDGAEFIVKTDKPIPIRALAPVLYIGEDVVTEVTSIAPNTYRFVAPERKQLKRDAPISLGWTGQRPADAQSAKFRYEL